MERVRGVVTLEDASVLSRVEIRLFDDKPTAARAGNCYGNLTVPPGKPILAGTAKVVLADGRIGEIIHEGGMPGDIVTFGVNGQFARP